MKHRSWMACAVLAMLFTALAPGASHAIPIADSGYLELSVVWGSYSNPIPVGNSHGYLKFDRRSFDAYDEWLALQIACWENTDPSCDDLGGGTPLRFQYQLLMLA